ncbi:MAG: biopolymer transporter ExbD [Candidatus Omnitrophica bacterium]|nr:biopolymer transporter ExbD [Candidatus Omnitrophota bacterium]
MKFKGRLELEHGLKPIDIAPLIDIMFQLLIFFMLTSSFIMQPGIRVTLPRAATSEVIRSESIEILITGESVVYANGAVVTMKEIKKLLAAAGARKQAVLIKSDKQAHLGKVVEIWDIARDSGITHINIATNHD